MIKTRKTACFVLLILLVLNLFYFLGERMSSLKSNFNNATINSKNALYKRNWEDQAPKQAAFNKSDLKRLGPSTNLSELQKRLYVEYGFDALLSDQISVNRSVPDIRPEECLNITYSTRLPKTSIIIIFYNERLSVLLRTIHSILNRTPDELIEEIILVDDASTWTDVLEPLDDYLYLKLPFEHSKVRLVRLPVRRGLIVARMEGARNASKGSEAFVFLDSHFEVNYNWLPPLLDPIASNPRACTGPAIDRIMFATLEYRRTSPFRGYFDWYLGYQVTSLHEKELYFPARNYNEYVLMGCAIAIGKQFFWDLGGFDEGMELWGGEQFELSFKVWMCGGELITVPCSRMGHLFRDENTKGNTNLYGNYSFTDRNFRRLIDVWMDEQHREYVLFNKPTIKVADPGDITERISIRDRLQCKSFTWMLENIMPDLKDIVNPPIKINDFGNGWIQNMMYIKYCMAIDINNSPILEDCNKKDINDYTGQYWHYTWRCEFRVKGANCLKSNTLKKRVTTQWCHHSRGNQKWFYDHVNQWIMQVEHNVCIVANVKDMTIDLDYCDKTNLAMRWMMRYYNGTAVNECYKIE